jgi:hypothetical protein
MRDRARSTSPDAAPALPQIVFNEFGRLKPEAKGDGQALLAPSGEEL